MPEALLDALRGLVGARHVLTGDGLAAYELDWRKRWQGRARAVVRPASTDEAAAVVAACAAHRVPIVAQGGNTGLVGGGVPDATGTQLLLSTTRMNRVRTIDASNLTITVEAGCTLHAVQQAASERSLLFPLSLAAEGSCTIGGNLATNAGGTQVLRYGNARELCLGLEVVTAEGRLWQGLGGLRKDNTGYDLRDLFIGSEGTLGLITAATLRLFPMPPARTTAWLACTNLGDAIALLALARSQLDAMLTGFEVMSEASLALVRQHFPQQPRPLPPAAWTVLMEQSAHDGESAAAGRFETLLERALEQGCAADAVVAQTVAQSRAMWHLRESIPLAQSEEGPNIKHDIALPISQVEGFVHHTDAALAQALPGSRLVTFGHLGDGNLHYNLQPPQGEDAHAFLAAHEALANRIVYDAVCERGGTISAEHGIGALKREELAQRKSPVALDLMHRIKAALDPQNLMNPGRLL